MTRTVRLCLPLVLAAVAAGVAAVPGPADVQATRGASGTLSAVVGGVALAPVDRPPPPDPFPLRRLLVPADRPLPDADAPFRRMARDEFEAKVRAAAVAVQDTADPPRLVKAEYRAAFAPGRLVGSAEWTLANPTGRPAALPVDGLKVAVSRAAWATGKPAVLFHSRANGKDGLSLWADDPDGGRVAFDWSLRGDERPDGERFELQFPPTPLAVLTLTLPADREPTADRADVLLTGPTPAAKPTERTWTVHLGSRPTVGLTVRAADRRGPAVPLRMARTARYDLSPGEVRATFEFAWDAADRGANDDREFTVDRGLRVTDVAGAGGEWTFTPGDGAAPGRLLVPLRGSSTRRLTVTAVGPPAASGGWPLPGVRPTAELPGADAIAVVISPDLKLDGWAPGDYRASAAGTQPDRGYRLDFTGTFATNDVPARRPPVVRLKPVDVEVATDETLEWHLPHGRSRLTARLKLKAVRGPLAAVQVQVAPGYVLDAAAAGDDAAAGWGPLPGVAGGWQVELQRAVPTGGTVEVRLDFTGPPGPAAGDPGDPNPPGVPLPLPAFAVLGAAERTGVLVVSAAPGVRLTPRTTLPHTAEPGGGFRVPYRGREPTGEVVAIPPTPRVTLTGVDVSGGGVTLAGVAKDHPLGGLSVFVPSDDKGVSVNAAGATATRLADGGPWLAAAGGTAAGAWPVHSPVGRPMTVPGSWWRLTFARPVVGEFSVGARYPLPDRAAPPVIAGADPGTVRLVPKDEAQAVEPGATEWKFGVPVLRSVAEADRSVTATFSGRITSAAGPRLPIALPPDAVVEWATVDGKRAAVDLTNGRIELPLPQPPPGGSEFKVRYRLPPTSGGFVRHYISPTPTLPRATAPMWRWAFPEGVREWPGLAPSPSDHVADDFVVDAITDDAVRGLAWALAGLFAGACIPLACRRGWWSWLPLAFAAPLGFVSVAAVTGWGEVCRPAFAACAVAAVVVIVRRLPMRSASAAVPAAVALVVLFAAASVAQSPEVATVYLTTANGKATAAVPQAVLDRLDALAAPPLPEVVVTVAEYACRTDADALAVDATFRLLCTRDGTLALPLSGVRLLAARLDGKEAFPDAGRADRYAVAVNGVGPHELKVSFAVAAVATGGEREARFGTPDAPACRVTVGGGVRQRQWDVPTRRGGQALDGRTLTAEHGGGAAVAVRWRDVAAADGAKPTVAVKEAAVWDAGEGEAAVTAAFAYRIDGGTLDRLRLEVPDGLEPVRVAVRTGGVGVREWSVGAAANGWRAVDVRLQGPAEGKLTLVLKAVPVRPLTFRPVLAVPRAADVADADRDTLAAIRYATGTTADGVNLSGAIDYPAEALKELAVPDLGLDVPVARAVRRSPRANVELRPNLVPPSATAAAAHDVRVMLGRTAEAEGAVRGGPGETAVVEFHLPAAWQVREVRAAGLAGWARAGSRVQVWLAKPTANAAVRWSAALAPGGDAIEVPLPRALSADAVTLRVAAADGWAVAPVSTTGLRPAPGAADELSYAAEPTGPKPTFRVRPLPPPARPPEKSPAVEPPSPAAEATPPAAAPAEEVASPVRPPIDLRPWGVALWLAGLGAAAAVAGWGNGRWRPECVAAVSVLAAVAVGGWWAVPFWGVAAVALVARGWRLVAR